MTQVGENNGVTGIISLTGGKPFNGQVEGWDAGFGNTIINRAGPGTNGPSVRCEPGSGSVTLKAVVNKRGYPFPSSLEKVSGDVTMQWDTGVTVKFSIVISRVEIKADSTKNRWVLGITAALNGIPVIVGFDGAQQAGTATFADQSLWEGGRPKQYDPAGLGDSDQELIDVSGLANATSAMADASDLAKVAAVVASATPPRAGMKVIAASIVRTGATGARISLQYGYDNAADRIIKGAKSDAEDANGLEKTATRAVIHLAGDDPTYPDTPAGLKLTDQNTQPLTGSLYAVTVFRYAIDDPKDRIENGQARDITDPDNLRTESTRAAVHDVAATPTVPAAPQTGIKLIGTQKAVINNNKAATTFRYGLRTVKEQIENDGTTWTYSTVLGEYGSNQVTIEHYTGPFQTWRETARDTFFGDPEARAITFRRFVGDDTAGTVFVTRVFRAATSSIDFLGGYKVELGIAEAYTDNRGVYRDGDKYKVFVISNRGPSASNREVRFGMGVSGVRMNFQIIKKVSGSDPPDPFVELIGKTNNNDFLGFAGGLARYVGSGRKQIADNIYVGYYNCVYDSNGHIDRYGAVSSGIIPYNSTTPPSGTEYEIPGATAWPFVKPAESANLSLILV